MINLNARDNPTKTEHIHTRNREVATLLLCTLCRGEYIHHDDDLSTRAGYTVFSVRLEEDDPKTEVATISDLGTRYEVNDHNTGRTTCIWYD